MYEKNKHPSRRVLNRHTGIILPSSKLVNQSIYTILNDGTVYVDDEIKQKLLETNRYFADNERDSLWKKYMKQENEKQLAEEVQLIKKSYEEATNGSGRTMTGSMYSAQRKGNADGRRV